MNKVHINVFTDPTCPFAYSMEPTRWRLQWLYGDHLSWQTTMIVLSGYDGETSPMTPELISSSREHLRDTHGMPMNIKQMPRVPQTLLASQNYIAIRNHSPKMAETFLRHLRVASMDNALVDEQETLNTIIAETGLDPDKVNKWRLTPDTETTLTKDAEAARNPGKHALHFSHKLSTTSTDRVRYPASSYVFSAGDTVFELPGFWPLEAYEAIIGNLLPSVKRVADPTSVQQVLKWAETPLATIEVAIIANLDIKEARAQLKDAAHITSVGQDGFWTLN